MDSQVLSMEQQRKLEIQTQIEQMTGSQQQLTEKEIQQQGDVLVEQQYQMEKVQEERRNFLEGRGRTLGSSFVDSTAAVANHAPVMQKGETKSQRKMNRNIMKKYSKHEKKERADRKLQKRFYEEENPETNFIRATSFASEYQYQTLADAKKWMMENPENYMAHKEAVDQIYRDLYIASEVYGSFSKQAHYYSAVADDAWEERDAAMQKETVRRMEVIQSRQSRAQNRVQALADTLQMLLRGKQISDQAQETLQKYENIGPTQSQAAEQEKIAGITAGATFSRDILKEKEKAVIPLIEERVKARRAAEGAEPYTAEELKQKVGEILYSEQGRTHFLVKVGDDAWNQKVVDLLLLSRQGDKTRQQAAQESRLADEISRDFYDRQQAVDLEKYAAMSDEELMGHIKDFEEFGLIGMRASDVAKYHNVFEEGAELVETKISLREKYLADRNMSVEELDNLSAAIQNLAQKARMLWYVEAYKNGLFSGDILATPEKSKFDALGSEDAIMEFIHNRLQVSERNFRMCADKWRKARADAKASA